MANEQRQFDMKRIAGTLKYGNFDGSKRKYLLLVYCIFSTLMIACGTIAAFEVVPYALETGGQNPVGATFAVLGLIAGTAALPVLLGVIVYRNEKQRNEISLWLQDAVELTAYSREIGKAMSNDFPQVKVAVKIRVEFKPDGKQYKYESRGTRAQGEDGLIGRHQVWIKYADRPVDIWYSPKYKEVVVLKDRPQRVSDENKKV